MSLKQFIFYLSLLISLSSLAQKSVIKGTVSSGGRPLEFANVGILGTTIGASTSSSGEFQIKDLSVGTYKIRVSSIGYIPFIRSVTLKENETITLHINLQTNESQLGEVVITGTMKESFKSQSPVPIEVITSKFFQKNPSPSLFEAMSMVNGVQPQLNCNVCNTGDIHINGMEGPYTMITIDGMPIVSSLSTVYGLSGIPNSMVQRVEVVKGPASTLYGSEAVGGLINIITKNPSATPKLSVDLFGTSNLEFNNDISFKANLGGASALVGINYFNFKNKMDKNGDNFTDLTLQDRISVFNKWTFERKEGRQASLAARYVYEDRWGGEMGWNSQLRGGDSIYGESIYTSRWEVIGNYGLPVSEDISFQFSYTSHHQNSAYGQVPFYGQQNISFGQLLWKKPMGEKHNWLIGLPFRYTFYDDNTVGTQSGDSILKSRSQNTLLPGIFIQDEIAHSDKLTTLAGIRYDFNSDHGGIFSPRVSLKYSLTKDHILRLSGGNGYRVVNLFTEDHAALTGSRRVIIKNELKPEQSYNVNLNYTGFINHDLGFMGLDASLFYTYFTNKIVGDFLTEPDKIIYDNLEGFAVSKGISLNTEFQFMFPLKITVGGTWMEVYQVEKQEGSGKVPQLNAPKFSGNFTLSYNFQKVGLTIDYTGKVTGPMHLSTVENDYRPSMSPWYSLQNIQLTKKLGKRLECYGGVKNISNFIPKDPLMRPDAPFTADFDTSYNYAPILGIRGFLGLRFILK